MTKLIQVLKQIAPLTDENCERLMKITKTVELQKGDLWIEAGKQNYNMAFLEEGYLRRSYLKDGNEVTNFFYLENDICADLASITGNSLPIESVVAMEKTTLTVFSYHEFSELCKLIPAFEQLHRLIYQLTFFRFYNIIMSPVVKTPKQRYDDLMVKYPKLVQSGTQNHIASYLGISTQHLNRIRSAF
jgi:CRP-like cAMP-binding protein